MVGDRDSSRSRDKLRATSNGQTAGRADGHSDRGPDSHASATLTGGIQQRIPERLGGGGLRGDVRLALARESGDY